MYILYIYIYVLESSGGASRGLDSSWIQALHLELDLHKYLDSAHHIGIYWCWYLARASANIGNQCRYSYFAGASANWASGLGLGL